jgi:hypothetical protein
LDTALSNVCHGNNIFSKKKNELLHCFAGIVPRQAKISQEVIYQQFQIGEGVPWGIQMQKFI